MALIIKNMQQIIIYIFIAIASLISLTLHELSHAYVAHLLGDDTAKNSGRLTLNPLAHIDIVGLLCLIVFRIGWAKPVPVNPYNFRNRKSSMLLVSLAGPLTNLILAILAARIFAFTASTSYYLSLFILLFVRINIGLAVFNILPFPPLDGSKIIASLLPEKLEHFFYKYERYLYIIVLIMYFTGIISKVLYPAINFLYDLFLS